MPGVSASRNSIIISVTTFPKSGNPKKKLKSEALTVQVLSLKWAPGCEKKGGKNGGLTVFCFSRLTSFFNQFWQKWCQTHPLYIYFGITWKDMLKKVLLREKFLCSKEDPRTHFLIASRLAIFRRANCYFIMIKWLFLQAHIHSFYLHLIRPKMVKK